MHPKIKEYLKQHDIGVVASYGDFEYHTSLEKIAEDNYILTDFSLHRDIEKCKKEMDLGETVTALSFYKWLPQTIAFKMEKSGFCP